MSYLLPHLHTGYSVDQAILSVSVSDPDVQYAVCGYQLQVCFVDTGGIRIP